MNRFVLSLGTNLGNRYNNLQKALKMLGEDVGKIVKISSIYESEAWGFEANSNFYNICIILNSALLPSELLKSIKQIELKMGRKKKVGEGYESRIIDIDILLYNKEVILTEDLSIPHLKMNFRKFVLLPLLEISPDEIDPISNNCFKNICIDSNDNSNIKGLNETFNL